MHAHLNYEENNFTHWQNYSNFHRLSSQFVSNGGFVVKVWRKLKLALLFGVRAEVDRTVAQKHGVVANKRRDPSGFPIIAGGFNRPECSCDTRLCFLKTEWLSRSCASLQGAAWTLSQSDASASARNLSDTLSLFLSLSLFTYSFIKLVQAVFSSAWGSNAVKLTHPAMEQSSLSFFSLSHPSVYQPEWMEAWMG